jgi:hypothetical protein
MNRFKARIASIAGTAGAVATTLGVENAVADAIRDVGSGGHGGHGGIASVHDIANATADASSAVFIDNVQTGDAFGHNINVDAFGASDPVVVSVAGSFSDTGVNVFAPGGNAQAGTTGGNGLIADASADGGRGGNNNLAFAS